MKINFNNRQKTQITKQVSVIAILAAMIAVFAIAAAVVQIFFKKPEVSIELPLYDEVTGDVLEYDIFKCESGGDVTKIYKDDVIVLTADSEITYRVRPFIYPQISVENTKEIVVSNEYGEFSIYLDEQTGEHLIKGCEMQIYDEQALSNLRFQARFMLATQRFDEKYETEEQLSAFGLDEASSPAKVTVTDTDGNTYSVLIGKKLVSDAGYYAKSPDRPYVYVLDSSVSIFFDDRNSYISPILTMPMSQNEYQYASSFSIYKKNEPFIISEIVPDEQRVSSSDTDLHKLTYPARYPVSFDGYYDALECFANLSGSKTVEANVLSGGFDSAYEIFEKYGLNESSNDVCCTYNGTEHRFITGSKFVDENGETVYYAYSVLLDTIVELPLSSAPFLEYELMDFINPNFFQVNIAGVSEIEISASNRKCRFVLDTSSGSLAVTEAYSGKTIDTASFRQFYISLLTPAIEGYAAASDVTGDTEVDFTVRSVYGEETQYRFSLISTTRELLTLNGNSEFYVPRSAVLNISEKLEKLISGEVISPES